MDKPISTLYIVPTPIGNLEDITFRAIRVLKEVDLVLAEDTRQTKKLFQHYSISSPLQSYHLHNEHQKVAYFCSLLENGQSLALVSDAGTPGISDPGFLLIRAAIEHNIKVEPLPGASALITALVGAGLPMEKFVFEGFLPQKKGRQTKLQQLANEHRTIVLYESPHRLVKTLTQLSEVFSPEKPVVVARELTKIYEEYYRGNLQEAIAHFSSGKVKGEIVLVLSP